MTQGPFPGPLFVPGGQASNPAAQLVQDVVLQAAVMVDGTGVPTRAGVRVIVTANYPATILTKTRVVTFKATINASPGVGITANVDLYNETDAEIVTGTALSTSNTGPTEVSAVLTVGAAAGNLKNGKMYSVRIAQAGGGFATLSNARLEISYV